MTIKHVRRKANRAADFLANWGSQEERRKIDSKWKRHNKDSNLEQLSTILNQDNHEATTQRQ